MVFKNCTFFNEEFEKEYGDIRVEDGIIKEIGLFPEDGKDMSTLIILPGFVDIHIHGANGGDTADCSEEALNKMSSYLAKCGVTSFCPTTMTKPVDELVETAKFVNACSLKETGAKIVGINFEGPFISKEKCGSQNKDYIIEGNKEDFDKLFKASGSLMKLITVAPENCKDGFIEYAKTKCTVSIGHTNADENICKKAAEEGVSHITHLYNAMSPVSHRKANAAGFALNSDLRCELICDGYHVCPEVLRLTFKILGEDRAVVVSDSMRASGLGVGEYELGGQKVFVKENDGVARLEDGTIAASVTNLFEEFKNLLNIGIDIKSALKACSANPAKAIGEYGRIGSLSAGKAADFTVIDEDMNIKEVYINGTLA